MLVDLFSNESTVKFANMQRGYIKRRDLTLFQGGYDKLLEYRDEEISKELKLFKKYANKNNVVKDTVRFETLANYVSSDRFWKIELTGLTDAAKEYSIAIDLSDNLAEILFMLCGSNPQAVRRIPDYHDLSKAIMGNDFEKASRCNFGAFYDIDLKLNAYLASTLYKSGEYFPDSKRVDKIANHFFFTIITDILCKSEEVRTYIAATIKDNIGSDYFVIRSFTFDSIICTSSKRLDFNYITVKYDDFTFDIPIRQYRRLEILEG